MVSTDQIKDIQGGKALDSDGSKIGSISQIYLDDRSGEPEWATVHTGLFGTSETFIPLQDAQVEGKDVRFPYTKDKVKDAPRVDADQHLDVQQEQELYKYYGVTYAGSDTAGDDAGRGGDSNADRGPDTAAAGTAAAGTAAAGTAAAGTAAAGDRSQDGDTRTGGGTGYDDTAGRDTAAAGGDTAATTGRDTAPAATGGPTTDKTGDHHRSEAAAVGDDTSQRSGVAGDGTITRHEEQLHVGTETRESGRARLRKYVTTEEQTVTVPVSHEEVHIERVPVAEGTAVSGDAFQESEQEVTLHEEVPVVTKEAHAVEGVRLTTEQVREDRQVTEQVRKEHIEVDGKDIGEADQGDRR
ncbi:PRC and DUF2382 domain-containing protein [Allobranchiibius sp. GilTou38]|uniref:DUF2382 domain-containing protein n=1 Tax=Allobranchiibius sp. GilTou38 TaxID=2815210 RepID=UPI001AA0D46A|nr:PRC and DUF2382 domain-containing protein [Allobranchiibius sp. GilTou38]MBO1765635.1 YsnF/AvaK domain-containing protein [Allobranchiibius sp. GilTou38]